MLVSKHLKLGLGATALMVLSACGGGNGWDIPVPLKLSADFNTGIAGWVGGIADYTDDTAPSNVQQVALALPAPLTGNGYFIAGKNRSDDALIYVKKQFGGLVPSAKYKVLFDVKFASNTPSGCFGVGGAPGESVYVVAAATAAEPVTLKQADGNYRLNIDRGNQAESGKSGKVLGNIANGLACGKTTYVSKTVQSAKADAIEVTADKTGKVWLMLGIDSGFEASGQVYLQSVSASVDPA